MDSSGNLYGTTPSGGASNNGTVFEVVSSVSYSVTGFPSPASGHSALSCLEITTPITSADLPSARGRVLTVVLAEDRVQFGVPRVHLPWFLEERFGGDGEELARVERNHARAVVGGQLDLRTPKRAMR